ncbi:MAG: AAA family ATPase [Candidatus Omnitrophica bacterium]|nr:AAA family ATPase [Candidatus Omnitrophota bacterium]
MGYVIAMAGKGGTGKTTVAALIVRILKDNKLGSILAIDADPNSNLADALGIKVKASIGEILDEICVHPEKVPAGMPKERFIEYEVQTAVSEGVGFDCLTMGRPEGPGCYCYVNNVLRDVLGKLIKDYDFVIIDNEAGLEHLSRRTTRSADALVVVSDASKVGLKAAERIIALAKELKIQTKKNLLIINRFNNNLDKEKLEGVEAEYLGNLAQDAGIEKISLNGGSLMELSRDALVLTALNKIGEKIWQRN